MIVNGNNLTLASLYLSTNELSPPLSILPSAGSTVLTHLCGPRAFTDLLELQMSLFYVSN